MAKLTDPNASPMEMALALGEGVPGALRVLADLYVKDPIKSLFLFLHIDTLELYGPKIWMLYKDVCGENLNEMISVLDKFATGELTKEQIQTAVETGQLPE